MLYHLVAGFLRCSVMLCTGMANLSLTTIPPVEVEKEIASTPVIEGIPTTGAYLPAMHPFDAAMIAHMKAHRIPGGALAVVVRGRLVYARGYGYADLERQTPVQPDALFRIASVSKPITAVAILTLVQSSRHRLDLDAPVFPLLGLKPFLPEGKTPDPRLNAITVRHLLQHSGGWDRERSGDIMFQHFQIAAEMGIPLPVDHTSLIRWTMGRPLDFDPGTRYAYSNFGYCVLGRVIEKVTGMSYEAYVRKHVLAPMGIRRARIGRGQKSERFTGEVCYYDGDEKTTAAYFDRSKQVPTPYGFASPQTMDAHGGWIASVVDLARFAVALDRPGVRPVLNPSTTAQMYARPAPPLGHTADGSPTPTYYGLGWMVRPLAPNGSANYWHSGSMPGTSALLVRLANGLSWAVLFNKRADGDIDGALHRAAAQVSEWPAWDLFNRYR
ncbi:MAG: serine hydrolase domain-containing protein [Chloroherpetonaceae bacterium]|nr:beta-lactamase family protein [Chthonomonadaceae bacterium]MDW8206998.1 serine hydrolase domain-containing protein [Chloroherpetonaceae bacterium]